MSPEGYKAASTASVNIMDVFARASGQQTNAATINVDKTPMSKVSGINHVADLPKVNAGDLKVNTQNAADISGKQATAMTMREQVAGAASNFAKDVQQVQATMDVALKEASQTLGIDPKQATATMHPTPVTTHAVAGAAMGLAIALPGADMALGLAQAISDVKNERGNLTPTQEAKLADEMQALLSPKRDEQGNVVAPPAVDSDFDFEVIKPEEIKNLYKAPQDHPEGKQIWGTLNLLDEEIIPHLEHAKEHEFDNTGNKLQVAAETTNVAAITSITGDQATAETIVATTADEVTFQSGSLLDLKGVVPEAEDAKTLYAKATETPIFKLDNEFDPQALEAKATMSVGVGSAA